MRNLKKNLFIIGLFVLAVCIGPVISEAGGRYSRSITGGSVDNITPADGTLNVTGSLALSASSGVTFAGTGFEITASDGQVDISGGIASTGNLSLGGTAQVSVTSGRLQLAPASTFGVDISTSGSKATCDATNRGSIFYEAGGAGVADVWYGCSKQAAGDSYAWRDLATPVP